jgi:hypothetical protein
VRWRPRATPARLPLRSLSRLMRTSSSWSSSRGPRCWNVRTANQHRDQAAYAHGPCARQTRTACSS